MPIEGTHSVDLDGQYSDLYALQHAIKESLEACLPDCVWLRAEIASFSVKPNGHCYLELSQSEDGEVVAKARATIWRTRYRLLSEYFESVTGSRLAAGMEVLVQVKVSYSEIYGLSLNITDINPEWTVGDAERKRRETVLRLEREGLLELQKELQIVPVPYRLAVISASGAAGFGDFMRHLTENEYGFVYRADLFEAVMQGQDAPASVCGALCRIGESSEPYDAVLIMRGGGSVLDLACFDDYEMAKAIALCPIPVFTAIGHDRDTHVADLVACRAVKTPTALADLIIDTTAAEDELISSLGNRLLVAFSAKMGTMQARLATVGQRVTMAASSRIDRENARLDMLRMRIKASDPRTLLAKGYTVVLDGSGKRVRNASRLKEGDTMSVMMEGGRVFSTVVRIDLK